MEEEESQTINKSELRASFYRIMEALEEFNDEANWKAEEVANFVFAKVLKSSNPISIFELE